MHNYGLGFGRHRHAGSALSERLFKGSCLKYPVFPMHGSAKSSLLPSDAYHAVLPSPTDALIDPTVLCRLAAQQGLDTLHTFTDRRMGHIRKLALGFGAVQKSMLSCPLPSGGWMRPWHYLGEFSNGIYLWHFLVLQSLLQMNALSKQNLFLGLITRILRSRRVPKHSGRKK